MSLNLFSNNEMRFATATRPIQDIGHIQKQPTILRVRLQYHSVQDVTFHCDEHRAKRCVKGRDEAAPQFEHPQVAITSHHLSTSPAPFIRVHSDSFVVPISCPQITQITQIGWEYLGLPTFVFSGERGDEKAQFLAAKELAASGEHHH